MNDFGCLKSVDDIINLYNEYGSTDYIGEDISQTEHAIQGALLAKEEGYDDETVVAILLHDIGHLIGMKYQLEQMDTLGALFHERIGSEFLRHIGMSEKVCELIKSHVDAKRYLVSVDEEYYEKLSESSKGTLVYQGGKMNEEEIKIFENNQMKETILKMRTWDDKAKVKDMKLPDFTYFKEIIEKLIF